MLKGERIRIGFLIFPGFPMACLTSMIEPLRAANEIVRQDAFDWVLISEDGNKVEASARVSFDVGTSLAAATDLDQIYVLSAPSSQFEKSSAGFANLRRHERHGALIGAISGGVFPMARAGLLRDVPVSVHWCYAAAFEAEFPDLNATDEVIINQGRRATASGAAAAFDLSLQLIEATLGPNVATEVACWFQHPLVRGQGIPQRKPTVQAESTDDMLPAVVRTAISMFSTHLEDPISVADVAAEAGVSTRQLERVFKKTTGRSPLHYYRALRMNAARQLVLYSKSSMTDIAMAVGYASSTPMIQNYAEVFGVHPTEDRAKINMFRVRENAIVPSV
jgi:transcriptional regulator GlxA family with amidase domain